MCARSLSSSFSKEGPAHFFVVVEEEGLFCLASSSLNGLFTGRTTRVFLLLLFFYALMSLGDGLCVL